MYSLWFNEIFIFFSPVERLRLKVDFDYNHYVLAN